MTRPMHKPNAMAAMGANRASEHRTKQMADLIELSAATA